MKYLAIILAISLIGSICFWSGRGIGADAAMRSVARSCEKVSGAVIDGKAFLCSRKSDLSKT